MTDIFEAHNEWVNSYIEIVAPILKKYVSLSSKEVFKISETVASNIYYAECNKSPKTQFEEYDAREVEYVNNLKRLQKSINSLLFDLENGDHRLKYRIREKIENTNNYEFNDFKKSLQFLSEITKLNTKPRLWKDIFGWSKAGTKIKGSTYFCWEVSKSLPDSLSNKQKGEIISQILKMKLNIKITPHNVAQKITEMPNETAYVNNHSWP